MTAGNAGLSFAKDWRVYDVPAIAFVGASESSVLHRELRGVLDQAYEELAFGSLIGRAGTGVERVKVGRAILNNFERPTLPFFLLDLCRQYAAKHREWPPEKWPVWLRTGPG